MSGKLSLHSWRSDVAFPELRIPIRLQIGHITPEPTELRNGLLKLKDKSSVVKCFVSTGLSASDISINHGGLYRWRKYGIPTVFVTDLSPHAVVTCEEVRLRLCTDFLCVSQFVKEKNGLLRS